MIRLAQVRVAYEGREVLHVDDLEFQAGQFVTIVGPNGAGKSTLLSVIAGLLPHYEGTCLFDGKDLAQTPRRDVARIISFVPQQVDLNFPFSAEQIVMMGRTPHCDGWFESPEDMAAVEQAMALTDTAPFRGRDFRTLSGGERQRVVLASAFAQSPRILLLDEPTTFLDLKHQLSIFELLRAQASRGLLVIAVTHDLNLSTRYSHRVVTLQDGRVAADGAELSPETVARVFEVDPRVFLPHS